jgi:hypothetical protein
MAETYDDVYSVPEHEIFSILANFLLLLQALPLAQFYPEIIIPSFFGQV